MKKIFLFCLFPFCLPAAAQYEKPPMQIYFPVAIVIDSKNNLFVSSDQSVIIKITPSGEKSEFFATHYYENNPLEKWPRIGLFTPSGLAIDEKDNIYISDAAGAGILKVAPDGHVKVLAGYKDRKIQDGPAATASFKEPTYIAIDKMKNIYVVDNPQVGDKYIDYRVIRKITPDGQVSTLKDNTGMDIEFYASGLTCDDDGNLFACDRVGRCIKKITPTGDVSVVGGLCYKRKYNPIYKEGDIKTAEFMEPMYIALSKNGEVYFSDNRLNRIIKIANKKVSTVAGNSTIDLGHGNILGYSEDGYKDGPALKALFNSPMGIAFDKDGNLFIVDCINHCIRKLSTGGMVSTVMLHWKQ